MARTTTDLVKGILGRDYDAKKAYDLQPYIDSVTVVVDRVVTCALKKGITLSAAEQELIERWLAAHAYQTMDQAFMSKSTASASASFQGRTDLNFEGTKYGQMALSVDYSGCLMNIGKKQRARADWVGICPPSVQGINGNTGW